MKVAILCGGLGTRIKEETQNIPKPMLPIGGKPVVWHIMKSYAQAGFNEFVLCLGYKGEVIKDYFYNYEILNHDFTIELGTRNINMHMPVSEAAWKITLLDTGSDTMTGARIKRAEPHIDGDVFMVTYGDGVSDVDIRRLLAFHHAHGKAGTVLGVFPPSRYGELSIDGDRVTSFEEKPAHYERLINGGFFVFNRRFFDYLSSDDRCVLEREPLERLANDGELMVFRHTGFWQCMDTYRDYTYLNELWMKENPPWKTW
jgi:glucose-1-phosphate cytidylyltransferase